MKKRWKTRTMRRRAPLFALMMLAGIALAGGAVGLAARYVHQESESKAALSNQFYFTSDYLSEEGRTYTLAPGTTTLTIQLRNYADEYRWADMDITYETSVKRDGADSTETQKGTLSWSGDNGTSQDLVLNDLTSGTYLVTAKATAPFQKELKGTFVVQNQDETISYTVSDSEGSPYVLLTISTKEYGGTVIVDWPAGVIPDSTDSIFTGSTPTYDDAKKSYTSGTVTITDFGKYASESLRFFKADPSQNYKNNDGFHIRKE